MLSKVMVDFKGIEQFKEDIDPEEYNLLPYIYLFADEVLEPVVCTGAYFPEVDVPSYVKPVYIFNENPPFVCDYAITTFKIGNPEFMGSYFTPVKEFKRRILSVQGVTAYNSVLLLAAAGLEVQIPSMTFDVSRSAEIEEIRLKLDAERKNYVSAMTRFANQSFDRLSSGAYKDAVDWATNEAVFKISPRVVEFEKAIRGVESKLLRRLGVDFVHEGIPAIGSALLEKGMKDGARQLVASMLKALCTNLFLNLEERKYPEVVYGYRLKAQLSGQLPARLLT